MIKYAKIIDETTKECQVGLGTNEAYYKKIGMKKAEVHQSEEEETLGKWYLDEFLPEEEQEQVQQLDEELTTNDEETTDIPLSDN